MSETDTRPKLDKVQISALRKADRIVFRHTPDRLSGIEAIKENRPTERDPYAGDVTVSVPCMFCADDYGGNPSSAEYPSEPKALSWDDLREGRFHGFEMFHTPQSNNAWQTIVSMLRPGDVIGLRWQRSAGTSPAIFKCGVVSDTLKLWVERGDKCVATFIVSTRAFPYTSSEGMRTVRTRAY